MAKKQDAPNTFEQALEKLNKQYGVGTVLALDSKTTGEYDVFSTGSIAFDYRTLGVGGFVRGKMYELMGWEGTGSSLIPKAVLDGEVGDHAIGKKARLNSMLTQRLKV